MKLNQYLQPLNAPVTSKPEKVAGVNVDVNYELQARSIKISNFVNNAGTAHALGTLANATSVTVNVNLTSPFKKNNFGVPYISIYLGSAISGNSQIYPSYGTVGNQKWSTTSGFNWGAWNNIASIWSVNVENNSGATGTILVVADWKELRFSQKKGAFS